MLKEITIALQNENKELRSVIASTQELAEFNQVFFSVTQPSSASQGTVVLTFDPELRVFLVLRNLLAVIFDTDFDNIPTRDIPNEESHSFIRAKAEEAQRLLDSENQKRQADATASIIADIKTRIKAHYLNTLSDASIDRMGHNKAIRLHFNLDRHLHGFILPYLEAMKQEFNKANVIAARDLGTDVLRQHIPYRILTSN